MRAMKDSGIEWIGEVPEDWTTIKLKCALTIYAGTTPKSDNPNYWEGNIAWITPADYCTEQHYVFNGRKYITEAGFNSCNLKLLPKNSIIFSKRAPIGLVVLAGKELCINQGCLGCIVNSLGIAEFFYYLLASFEQQFNILGSGTTFKEISASEFSNFVIALPPLPEQQSIADFLDKKCGKIDDVVDKQRKLIEKLKEYKQAVITEAVTKGLDRNAPMKDSGIEEIGYIPKNWNVQRLKTIANVLRGGSPRPIDDYLTDAKDGLNWIKIGDTVKGYKYIEHCEQRIIIEGATKSRYVSCGTLLLTNSMSFGEPYILKIDGYIHDGWVAIECNDKTSQEYIFWLLCSDAVKLQFKKLVAGGVVQNLNIDKIAITKLPLPPLPEQQRIADFLDKKCAKIDVDIERREEIISKLQEYKKALIYEAVTGKREVPNV